MCCVVVHYIDSSRDQNKTLLIPALRRRYLVRAATIDAFHVQDNVDKRKAIKAFVVIYKGVSSLQIGLVDCVAVYRYIYIFSLFFVFAQDAWLVLVAYTYTYKVSFHLVSLDCQIARTNRARATKAGRERSGRVIRERAFLFFFLYIACVPSFFLRAFKTIKSIRTFRFFPFFRSLPRPERERRPASTSSPKMTLGSALAGDFVSL